MKHKLMKAMASVILLSISSSAVEVRVGKGDFSWDFGVKNFMRSDVTLDITTISLNEHHSNFNDSNIYYFFSADFYGSQTLDKITEFASIPVTTTLPFYGGSISDAADEYTKLPVPSDYKIRGFDLNLGIGYDLYKENNDFVGIGINTGLSMPVMKMKNYVETVQTVYDILDVTDTRLMTYKFGPAIQFNYELAPHVSAYGYGSYGIQHGDIENDWLLSSMNVDGTYSVIDLGVKYTPYKSSYDLGWFSIDPQLFLTLGFTYKSWDVDNTTVNLAKLFDADVSGQFSNAFHMRNVYFGIGYHF